MFGLFIPSPMGAVLMRIWYEEWLSLLFNPFGLPSVHRSEEERKEGDFE